MYWIIFVILKTRASLLYSLTRKVPDQFWAGLGSWACTWKKSLRPIMSNFWECFFMFSWANKKEKNLLFFYRLLWISNFSVYTWRSGTSICLLICALNSFRINLKSFRTFSARNSHFGRPVLIWPGTFFGHMVYIVKRL